MRKNDFITITEELIKIGEALIASSSNAEILRKHKTYSSCLKQLTQILSDIEDKTEISGYIEKVEEMNKSVEEKLIAEKNGIFKNIRTGICREHIRKKYNSKSQKSSLINKKS